MANKIIRVIFSSAIWVLIPAAQLLADESDAFQFFEEEAKVVTASKKVERIQDAPGIITVITAEDIRKFGARNLRDVLDRAPGVYTMNGTCYPNNVVSIRGDSETQSNTHVLWLLNSRPVREVAFGGINFPLLTSFPLELIDHIEFVSGPSSVLYGSNAYTGVINILTKQGHEKEATATIGEGTNSTTYGSVSGGTPFKDGGVAGAFRYNQSAGWRYSAKDEAKVSGSMKMRAEDTGLAMASTYKNWTMTGFYGSSHENDLGTLPRWSSHRTDPANANHGTLDLGYNHDITHKWNVGTNVTYNYFNIAVFDPNGSPMNHTGTSILTEATIRGNPLRNFNILLGGTGDYHMVDFNSGTLDLTETWWGAYTQADYQVIPLLKLLGGAQLNKPEGVKKNISPRAGGIITFNPNWSSKLLYGEAFRSPYLAETLYNSPAASGLHGNPSLVPETIQTYEAQVAYQSKKLQGAMTYFQSQEEHRIIRAVVNGLSTFINSNEIHSQGWEFEGTFKATNRLSLIGSFIHQINWDQNGVHDVTFMPNNMIKTGVSYASERGVTIGLFNSYFSQCENVIVVNPSALELNPSSKAYNWLTANVIFDLQKVLKRDSLRGMELRFYGVNLLNEKVFDPEYNRKIIDTLPARPGISIYGEFAVKY